MRVFQEYGQKPAVVGFSVKPALPYSARTVYAGAGPNPKPLNGEASLKPILLSMEEIRTFASVWDALEDTPEAIADMKVRSSLLIELKDIIKASGWTPDEAAKRCGLDHTAIDELLDGNVDLFPLEKLVGIAARLDRDVRVELLTHAPA